MYVHVCMYMYMYASVYACQGLLVLMYTDAPKCAVMNETLQ